MSRRALTPRLGNTLMGLSPLAALVLFLLTGSWLWFLAVPVVGVLVYGPGTASRGERSPPR